VKYEWLREEFVEIDVRGWVGGALYVVAGTQEVMIRRAEDIPGDWPVACQRDCRRRLLDRGEAVVLEGSIDHVKRALCDAVPDGWNAAFETDETGQELRVRVFRSGK
jgi:hypothetical protein